MIRLHFLRPNLFRDFDSAPGKIFFQAFSLRSKNNCCEKAQEAQKKNLFCALCTFLRPISVARLAVNPFSFNLCRRRFVLNFPREQIGKAA
jgi:hypothetical protein